MTLLSRHHKEPALIVRHRIAKIWNSGESDKSGMGGRCSMSSERRTKFRLLLLFLALVVCFGTLAGPAFAQRMPEAAKGPSVASQAPLLGKPGDYVGWQTCAGCHRAEAQAFMKTPHAPTGEALPTSPTAPTPGMSPSAEAGKKIFDDMVCAGCHTIGGQGGTVGPPLDNVGVRLTRADLMKRMLGRRAGTVMPPLPPDMPDQKISDLVDYLLTLKGKAEVGTKPVATAQPTTVTGCETCHGPGRAHADAQQAAGGDPAKEKEGAKLIFSFHANPKENAERCLACHVTGQAQEMFAHSKHMAAGVSCDQCHVPHLVKEVKDQSKGSLPYAQQAFSQAPQLAETVRWLHSSLLKQSQPNLCFTCHGNIQAQFALPNHHKVPEGLMKCTDCHNPHGSMNRSSLNATNWESCVKCHVEKRGPYVYEHAAVRVEGCIVCHNPHGNTNQFRLVRREIRLLCLQCHTGFHTQAQVPHSRLGYQTSGECTRCHVVIHGSDLSPYFLR
jgi:predicted CXXCH cytochrome family protein